MFAIFASFRKFVRERNGMPLSAIKANLRKILAYSLTTISLVLVLWFALPDSSQTPNPEYDVAKGPVIVEECVSDRFEGEICGERDLNPEFIQGEGNFRLFVFVLIAGAYYFLYRRIARWLENLEVYEVSGHKLAYVAKLDDIDLSNQIATRAYLVDADLSGKDLSGANLSGANLSGANLSGANLRDTNLGGANLGGANLSGANLRDAYLAAATMPDGSIHD